MLFCLFKTSLNEHYFGEIYIFLGVNYFYEFNYNLGYLDFGFDYKYIYCDTTNNFFIDFNVIF